MYLQFPQSLHILSYFSNQVLLNLASESRSLNRGTRFKGLPDPPGSVPGSRRGAPPTLRGVLADIILVGFVLSLAAGWFVLGGASLWTVVALALVWIVPLAIFLVIAERRSHANG